MLDYIVLYEIVVDSVILDLIRLGSSRFYCIILYSVILYPIILVSIRFYCFIFGAVRLILDEITAKLHTKILRFGSLSQEDLI